MPRRSATSSLLLFLGFVLLCSASPVYSAPPQLVSAVSRMTQGPGSFDIQLPLSGGTGVECRTLLNGLSIVLSFDQPITAGDASSSLGTATVGSFAGNLMTVQLANLADAQTITLTLSNVTNAGAEVLPSAAVTFRTLQGDVNASGSVTGADVNIVKAQVGATVDGSNFRCDVNGNGSITGADTAVVKSRIGASVTGGKTANTPPTISDIPAQNTATDTATVPVGFAVGDAESAVETLAVSAASSDQNIVPNAGITIGCSGGSRTISVTPGAGPTGTAIIPVPV